MPHYIALIHKEPGSSYGVSFPDLPGVIAAADSLDEAIGSAAEALAFAAEDWEALTGGPFPVPRSLDALRADGDLAVDFREAVAVAIPLSDLPVRPAAE
ncbi:MAG TPA: type II toxin-antitoxin system HicB family antitoxin [Microvirga sp.]|nr:type II toxin-antitoxin system HicB family antitoxin [Microvirga sp.]